MSKKILITSALPYVNNVPHLGNIIGCVLSADVFARFARAKYGKENVLYVCGSDEHGTATENKAKEEGVSPQELCDKYFAIHKDIYEWFSISFDIFGRTSKENHAVMTRDLFLQVVKNGFVVEEEVTQPFCTTCNTFLADRFIEGTCPFCGYEEARGDQCDNCGKLLSPSELLNPHCKADGTTPEFRKTKHLFLKLDELQPQLKLWVDSQSKEGFWTQNAIRTTNAWFKEGLKKRAITRDLKWGITLPKDVFDGRYKDKVFYVWFDAPIGYISITEQLLGDAWKKWWLKEEGDVALYQFMGKDNIPFHSIIFPATLMAAGNKHNLVYHLNATEYLNYEHTKFSKSRGVGVFGDDARKTGIPADVFRYVLCYYRPEHADSQFTWKNLQERLNNELVANFGNFVNRVLTFLTRFFDGTVDSIDEDSLESDTALRIVNWRAEIDLYLQLLDKVRLREALQQFMKLSSLGNTFFQDAMPWKTKDSYPEKAKQDLTILVNFVKDLAILIEPFMPATSENIFSQLNWSVKDLVDVGELSVQNHHVGKPKILFSKIDDETIDALREKFSGTQNVQNAKKNKKQEDKEGKKTDVKKEDRKADIKEEGQKKQKKLFASDLDLRVGEIVAVKKHPNAEKLFIETITFGSGEESQIVSGLVGYYKPEELVGKHIIVVRNLKPAKLRGEWSYGMLLAAEDDKGTVALILAPDAKPGSQVLPKEETKEPKKQISIDDFFRLHFLLQKGEIFLEGSELLVDESKLVADKGLMNGKIR